MTKRIAIIDDEVDLIEIIGFQIETWGFEVVTFASGEAALAGLAAAKVDLVMTDIRMPGINGLDVCRFVRAHMPSTPLVIMSGFSDEQKALEDLGVRHRLRKPFDMALMRSVLEELLNERTS